MNYEGISSGSYRYIRYDVSEKKSDGYCNIAEIKLYKRK